MQYYNDGFMGHGHRGEVLSKPPGQAVSEEES